MFQPSKTQDTYTVSGARITEALGNPSSTDENALLQSIPGVIPTFDSSNGGGLSIRGSLAVELGYQFDGVPFSAPFFDENGSQGFLNNIAGGSGGSLQVISGAGDATQGNNGGGTINTVAPRGTYPGKAELELEVGAPYYNHTFNFNDGFATQNGRISNFFAYSGSSYVPQYAPYGAPSSLQYTGAPPASSLTGAYYADSRIKHDDLIDNFVLRFGHDNNQSFQVLYRAANVDAYAGYGGLKGLSYYTTSAISDAFYQAGGFPTSAALAKLIPSIPYEPTTTTVINPDIVAANPLQFFKFEYTNNINSTTYFDVTDFNWSLYDGGTAYSEFPLSGFGTGYSVVGGSRTGLMADLTKTIGSNQTITLEGKYENDKPFWDDQSQVDTIANLLGLFGVSPAPGQPTLQDWLTPANTNAPVSKTNPCPVAGGCYIYSALVAAGKWTGVEPAIPNFGINYHGTDQQQWGIAFRDQYSPTNNLHLDFGVRVDGEQNKFGADQLGAATPSDVPPSKVGSAFLRPREVEPRAAVSYQLGPDDSVRASYGRSTQFFFGQTLGTPFNLSGLSPLLSEIPAKDTAAAPVCGSGTHGPGPGYSTNPALYQSGANAGNPAYFYKCPNYAVSIASYDDQDLDAPDLGGFGPPTYNNFDFAYSHQIGKGLLKGWASSTTAYARTGYNVEQNVLLLNGPPNPITGQSSASVFTTTANGNERTFGLEEAITTSEPRAGQAGLSGYATLNYINSYTNTPPVAGSSNLPILAGQLLQSGQYFRSGFVPPVNISVGATYKFKNGIRITPSLLANEGYAFGVGRSSFGFVNGNLYTIPETNFGVNTPYAGYGGPGNAYNASYYVDPQVPGSTFNPNVAGNRGYNEPAQAGNGRSPAEAYLNLNVEIPLSKSASVGVTVYNLANNQYTIPVDNPSYQAVGKGIAGPQTGQYAAANPLNAGYQYGAANTASYAGGQSPYLNGYAAGINFNVYARFTI